MALYPKETKKTKMSREEMAEKIKNSFGFDVPKTKVAPTPKPKAKTKAKPKKKDDRRTPSRDINPLIEQQRKALEELMRRRQEVANDTGSWPNYYTN